MREPDHKPEARRNSKCLGSTAGEAARRQLGEEIRGYPQWLPKPHKLTVVGVSLTCKLVGDKLILVPHGRKRTRTLNRLHSGYLVWYTREMRNLVNFAISHALNHANKLVPLESDFTSSFLTGTLFLIPFVCFFFFKTFILWCSCILFSRKKLADNFDIWVICSSFYSLEQGYSARNLVIALLLLATMHDTTSRALPWWTDASNAGKALCSE